MVKAIETGNQQANSLLEAEMHLKYPKNLRFVCLKCGICCGDTKQKKRHILLLRSEAERISVLTGQKIKEFAKRVDGKAPYVFEMRKAHENRKCVFLSEKSCIIYSERPLICRFYPFELRVTEESEYSFRGTRECPGLGKGDNLARGYFQTLAELACSYEDFDR